MAQEYRPLTGPDIGGGSEPGTVEPGPYQPSENIDDIPLTSHREWPMHPSGE